MAKRRRQNIDWVTVRYKDIYAIIGIVIILIAALGGGYGYWRFYGNPQVKAEKAIVKAQRMIQSLETTASQPEQVQAVAQGKAQLKEARRQYRQQNYRKALNLALDLISSLKDLQMSVPSSQRYAVLVNLEGDVEVKKANQHLFSPGKENMFLEDGDIVKTSKSSYARIKYHNGQFQVISPDSLVVIQSLSTTQEGGSRIEVALKQGRVETTTPQKMGPHDESVIATASTKVRPSAASRVGVAQDKSGKTTTSVFSGTTQIAAAGQVQTIDAGTSGREIVTSNQGILASRNLIAPPAALTPQDQQIIRVEDPVHTTVHFSWQGGPASGSWFEISARPLFSSLLAPKQLVRDGKLGIDGLPAGTYYWRLRAAGPQDTTYWSPIYRFRIFQVFQRPAIKRNISLKVDATPIGDGVIIQGSTDPGIHVSVNDIEVPVNADGSFSKIVLFPDVGTQYVQVRAFDDEGNEKIWRKQFQSASSY